MDIYNPEKIIFNKSENIKGFILDLEYQMIDLLLYSNFLLEEMCFLPWGQGIQSFVLLIPKPWQFWPPLLGGGLVQVLVLIFPVDKVAPGQRHSTQGPQGDQPPFTETK